MTASMIAVLNAPLRSLRDQGLPTGAGLDQPLGTGLRLHADAPDTMTAQLDSPAGRLLDLRTTVDVAGNWLALRVTLAGFDLRAIAGIGFWMRSAADTPTLTRACLRIGTDDGHDDLMFDQTILSDPSQSDHHALLVCDRHPTLDRTPPWAEFILFLPPAQDLHFSLIDLRLFSIPGDI